MITRALSDDDAIITRGFAGGFVAIVIKNFRRAVYMVANKVTALMSTTSPDINERK